MLLTAAEAEQMATLVGSYLRTLPTWTPESQAAAETSNESELAGEWGDEPVSYTFMLAKNALALAGDHLLAVAVTIRAENVGFATVTLTRTVLSAAAVAFYLLDPAAGARERLRRGWNAQLASYTEQLNAEDRGSAEYQALVDSREAVATAARRNRYRVSSQGTKASARTHQGWWLGDRHPSEMQLCEEVMSGYAGVGSLLYRRLSSFVHAQPHATAMMVMIDQPGRRSGTERRLLSGMTDAQLVTWVSSAVAALDQAMTRAFEVFGWDPAPWNGSFRPAMKRWYGILEAAAFASGFQYPQET